MIELTVNGKDLAKAIRAVIRFHKESKLYSYAQVVTLDVTGDKMTLSNPLIIGEAQNVGLIRVSVPTLLPSEKVKVSVPINKLEEVMHTVADELTTVKITDKVTFEQSGLTHTVPTISIDIPVVIESTMDKLKEYATNEFNLVEINRVLKELKNEVTNNTVDFALNGIYVTPTEAIVTNGMVLTRFRNNTGLPDGVSIYFPKHIADLLATLPKDAEYKFAQGNMGLESQPYVYLESDNGIEVMFQEWLSKDIYPHQVINDKLDGASGEEVDHEEFIKGVQTILQVSNIVVVDYQNGVMRGKEGTVEVPIHNRDIPAQMFVKNNLPKKTDFGKYLSVKIDPDTHTLVMKGMFHDKLIAGVIGG